MNVASSDVDGAERRLLGAKNPTGIFAPGVWGTPQQAACVRTHALLAGLAKRVKTPILRS